ncbi:MAG TPA: hypothetical protein VJH55_00050 [Candidatus Paceibacterota bacterium]
MLEGTIVNVKKKKKGPADSLFDRAVRLFEEKQRKENHRQKLSAARARREQVKLEAAVANIPKVFTRLEKSESFKIYMSQIKPLNGFSREDTLETVLQKGGLSIKAFVLALVEDKERQYNRFHGTERDESRRYIILLVTKHGGPTRVVVHEEKSTGWAERGPNCHPDVAKKILALSKAETALAVLFEYRSPVQAPLREETPDCNQCGHTTKRHGFIFKCENCANEMGTH